MYINRTYQDYQAASDKLTFIAETIKDYKSSAFYQNAITAEKYFRGDNEAIMSRKKYRFAKFGQQEMATTQITSNYFFRFVVQQNQYLLANGLQTKDQSTKDKLGFGFDKALEYAGERALVHGVAFGFWNVNKLEVFSADSFFGLLDERTSDIRLGVRFWQIKPNKPLYFQIYESDGMTEYVVKDGIPEEIQPKKPYVTKVRKDAISQSIIGTENYNAFPIIPLFANSDKRSELTYNLKSKIDAYDIINSDFSDNLERANFVYWVINNFGGTSEQVKEMLAEIEDLKATYTDDSSGNATATPHTMDVPYEARRVALDLLEKALYQDYMALNMDEIKGGSLTNVAIRTTIANLEMKVDRYEWQVFQFVQRIFSLIGIETEDIKFRRQTIANEAEIVTMIYQMRQDITQKKALELNPLIMPDEIEQILLDSEAEKLSGMPDIEELQKHLDKQNITR